MPSRPPPIPVNPDAPPRAGERIAKLLARAGIASRREVERMIAEGRVALAGVAIDTPATVLRSLDGVSVDGNPVAAPPAARLFAYHKPAGLLVTERDPRGRPTIYDRLPAGLPRVVPVGRLDLATEGLLLLTTDGALKRQLELPATGVERTYRARAYGPVSQAQLEGLIDGIEIDGVRYGGIDANLERRTGANSWIELTLTEGKNREVRRVLEHLGLQVGRLIRTRYGPIVLGDMPAGAVGEVRQHDLVAFRQSLRGGKGGDKAMRVMAMPFEPERAPEPITAAAVEAAQPPVVRGSASRASGDAARPGRGDDRRRAPDAPRTRSTVRGDRDAPRPTRDDIRPSGEGPRSPRDLVKSPSAAGQSKRRPAEPRSASTGSMRAERGEPASRARPNRPPAPAKRADRTADATAATPARPARPPQRKAGWARPKPPTGPKRPRG